MGTGIVSILLHNLPYNGHWLYWMSVVIFCLNVGLFLLFFAISLLRYILYPEIWIAMLRHPTQSLFLGTFPMGLATIVNMVVFVCVPAWGHRAIQLVSWLFPQMMTVGLTLTVLGMGFVVDRRCNCSISVLLPPFCDVIQHRNCYSIF
jgi:tellurite resistance protein TehA-like permease